MATLRLVKERPVRVEEVAQLQLVRSIKAVGGGLISSSILSSLLAYLASQPVKTKMVLVQ